MDFPRHFTVDFFLLPFFSSTLSLFVYSSDGVVVDRYL